MKKQSCLKHQWVRFIPDKPESGILYISREYKTATHLCCCGCRLVVVTPLNPAKWDLNDHGNSVSLIPSIGNWSFPCRSHYWIDHNRVKWAGAMSEKQITMVRKNDQHAVDLMIKAEKPKVGLLTRLVRWLNSKQ
jgi:Family of unknown function (DUF6527)